MKILLIGDIIGEQAITKAKEVIDEYKANFVIVNGENTAERNGNKQ